MSETSSPGYLECKPNGTSDGSMSGQIRDHRKMLERCVDLLRPGELLIVAEIQWFMDLKDGEMDVDMVYPIWLGELPMNSVY